MREINASRCTTTITWKDVPHLDEKAKDEMRRSTPEDMASAREFGIPAIGSGKIFPIDPRDVLIKPFELPVFWPRLYALDVGIRKTAAIWLAWDREEDVVYLYSEHYSGGELPSVHATAIKARGAWVPGVVDPSARNRSPTDGQRLFTQYTELGLNLVPAKNAVESGICRIQQMFAEDRIRVFSTLQNWVEEVRWYHRDEHGKIIKVADHLMDATRYAIHEYEAHAIVKPADGRRRPRYQPGSAYVGY